MYFTRYKRIFYYYLKEKRILSKIQFTHPLGLSLYLGKTYLKQNIKKVSGMEKKRKKVIYVKEDQPKIKH